MSAVKIESSRFGTIEVPAERVIEFPNGLIGLGGRRYAIVHTSEDSPFSWLHSLEDPALALPVTNPWRFFAGYAVEVADEESAGIAADPGDVEVWVTVRAGSELSDFYANLRAPILVAGGTGHQVINEAEDAPVRAPLFPALVAAA
jgi:flagellar assembly factor FliW